MSRSHTNRIENFRVVLGVLRETIFSQSVYSLSKTDDSSWRAELDSVEEENRRSKDESRALIFRIVGNPTRFPNPGDVLILKTGIDQYHVTAEVSVTHFEVTNGVQALHTTVPKTLEVHNLRLNRRKDSFHPPKSTSVLVYSGSLHTEGVFELTDYSRTGLGGTLKVPHGFGLHTDVRILGTIQHALAQIKVSAQIKRLNLLQSVPGDWDTYQVGVQHSDTQGPFEFEAPSKDERTERRKSERIAVNEQVTLKSLMDPDHAIRVNIGESSLTGFSCIPLNPAESVDYPIGATFTLDDSPLTVRLMGFVEQRLRFMICDGSISDRLQWLKRLSPYLMRGVSDHTASARELLRVFCESGALSSAYLKTQRTHKKEFLQPFEHNSKDAFWVHRWVQHNENREVSGHICALRIGDSCWFLADLAGSSEAARRIPPNYVPIFFKSFASFSHTQSPAPKHLYTWVANHPYWSDFRTQLLEGDSVLEHVRVLYKRTDSIESVPDHRDRIKKIRASDYKLIRTIQKQLAQMGLSEHALVFDFSVENFGSPQLSVNREFNRHYFLLSPEGNKTSWLLVTTDFPKGSSINRITDAVWALPLDSPNRDSISSLNPSLIAQISLAHGPRPTSLRIILPHTVSVEELVSDSSSYVTMEQIVAHPRSANLLGSDP